MRVAKEGRKGERRQQDIVAGSYVPACPRVSALTGSQNLQGMWPRRYAQKYHERLLVGGGGRLWGGGVLGVPMTEESVCVRGSGGGGIGQKESPARGSVEQIVQAWPCDLSCAVCPEQGLLGKTPEGVGVGVAVRVGWGILPQGVEYKLSKRSLQMKSFLLKS